MQIDIYSKIDMLPDRIKNTYSIQELSCLSHSALDELIEDGNVMDDDEVFAIISKHVSNFLAHGASLENDIYTYLATETKLSPEDTLYLSHAISLLDNDVNDCIEFGGRLTEGHIAHGDALYSWLDDRASSIVTSMDTNAIDILGEIVLEHYGMPHRSGRYPWGSGEVPYQHEDWFSLYSKNKTFLDKNSELKRNGYSEKDIAEELGCKNTSDLRAKIAAASNTNKKLDIMQLKSYLDKGYSLNEAARRTNIPASTARSLMNPKTQENAFKNTDISNQLKAVVAEKKYIDVGTGAETMLGDGGISNDRLDKVLKSLENEGYKTYEIKAEQPTNPGKYTTYKILAGPDSTFQEVSRNRAQIKTIATREGVDDSVGLLGLEKPATLDRNRVYIRYPSEGGTDLDGTITLRKGTPDLYLGENTAYSQVRINVDDKYYLKGMAVYGTDEEFSKVPKGVDVIFNTSKPDGSPDDKVFKKLKEKEIVQEDGTKIKVIDWDNPFGATIKSKEQGGQYSYTDPVTGEKKLSKINKVNSEGDWDEWSRSLASQFLSKQPLKLIKKQLDATIDIAQAEYDNISAVPNGLVRKYLLNEFASQSDAAAVDLKATGFPRQTQKVILPLTTLKPGECYAPDYDDGEELILIRYPHSGTFEIPKVRVNNRNEEGREKLGNTKDAIGIHGDTAAQLSGADFDGDSVTAIPIRGMEKDVSYGEFKKELKDFTGTFHDTYAKSPDAPETGKEPKGQKKFVKAVEMGITTNLIMDMTLQNAPTEDVIKAVKHSMVVIDAEKHNLDWKQSEIDNDIAALKKRYQGKASGGASTLISRSKGVKYVDDWDEVRSKIDPETGEIIRYYPAKNTVIGQDGKEHVKRRESTKMAETKDARTLMSNPEAGFPQEELYAEYANKRKAMANQARKDTLSLSGEYNPDAAKAFASEVASLNAKLNKARKNKPFERQAVLYANEVYRVKSKNLSKDMPRAERKKKAAQIKDQALRAGRLKYGAEGSKSRVTFTDREWEAIMSGAVRPSVVEQLLKNSTSETIKSMAMPRATANVTSGMRLAMYNMDKAGYTLNDIAQRLGISTSVVNGVLKPKS